MPSRCSQTDPIPQYRHGGRDKETIQKQQFKKSAAPQRSIEPKDKGRRPKCYNCGKRGYIQVDCWKNKVPREESEFTEFYTHKTVTIFYINTAVYSKASFI